MVEELTKPLLNALELANAASVTMRIAESTRGDPAELKRAATEVRMLKLLLEDIYDSVKLLNNQKDVA